MPQSGMVCVSSRREAVRREQVKRDKILEDEVMTTMQLTERKKRILRAIIETYIATAEPVGSKAVV